VTCPKPGPARATRQQEPVRPDPDHYEIELNSHHVQDLRDQLSRYVKAARKVTGSAVRPARDRRATENDARNKEIRS
jgi:hypothetical protein